MLFYGTQNFKLKLKFHSHFTAEMLGCHIIVSQVHIMRTKNNNLMLNFQIPRLYALLLFTILIFYISAINRNTLFNKLKKKKT